MCAVRGELRFLPGPTRLLHELRSPLGDAREQMLLGLSRAHIRDGGLQVSRDWRRIELCCDMYSVTVGGGSLLRTWLAAGAAAMSSSHIHLCIQYSPTVQRTPIVINIINLLRFSRPLILSHPVSHSIPFHPTPSHPIHMKSRADDRPTSGRPHVGVLVQG